MASLVPLLRSAEAAAMAAGNARVPVPMHVVERANPLDDSSPVVRRYAPVMGGVCGFAWVNVKGNSRVANAARKRYGDRDVRGFSVSRGWPSGLNINMSGFGQSMEMKMAAADAYAKVLRDAGHDAWSESRMD